MNNFIYHVPTAVYFGKGQVSQTGSAVSQYGRNVLVLYGSDRVKTSGLLGLVEKSLAVQGVAYTELGGVQPNPRIALVREAVELCKSKISILSSRSEAEASSTARKPSPRERATTAMPGTSSREKHPRSPRCPSGRYSPSPPPFRDERRVRHFQSDTDQKLAKVEPFLFPKFSVLDPELTFTVNAYQTAAGAVDT
jgi:alcohol dehydrogenase YqhD (iron-dependent ADH family)